jgi:DNA-binding transcriptional MerR regulator
LGISRHHQTSLARIIASGDRTKSSQLEVNVKSIDIGTLSARSGLPPSALRYYEEIGLITSQGRHGLRRQFGPDALLRLSLIALGKSAGFTLPEIAAMLGQDGVPDLSRDDLRARASDLDRQIRNLTALRDTMLHVADCRAPSHMECPQFRRLLKIAARRGMVTARKPKPLRKPV